MPIELITQDQQGHLQLVITGRFTFELHKAFSDVVTRVPEDTRHLVIDMTRTEYLDSSALGMLLLLRDRRPKPEKRLLVAPGSVVKEVLQIANFHQLFAIEEAVSI